jgi:hypothetical protein
MTPEEREIVQAELEQLSASMASAIVKLQGNLAGDYISTLRVTATEEFGIQWMWDWWWRPPTSLPPIKSTGPWEIACQEDGTQWTSTAQAMVTTFRTTRRSVKYTQVSSVSTTQEQMPVRVGKTAA